MGSCYNLFNNVLVIQRENYGYASVKFATLLNSPGVTSPVAELPCKYAENTNLLSPFNKLRAADGVPNVICVPLPSVTTTPAPLALPVTPKSLLFIASLEPQM